MKNITLTLPAELGTGIKKVDVVYKKATGKVEYRFWKEDGSIVEKTSDLPTIDDTAITVSFDA